MNPSIARKLSLIAEWEDKGMSSGLSKTDRSMDTIKKRAKQLAIAFAAAAAAIGGATIALFKFIKQGAEIQSVRDSFEGFLKTANMAPDTLDRIREAVRGTIADTDLMQSSIQALSAGLQPDELIRFWEMSKQIADVASRDTLEVFDALSRAVNKLEAESLEQIGITVRMGDVMKAYQEKTGKATKELTLLDRQIAFMNAVNEKYVENFWKVGDVTTRVRERVQVMSAEFKNVRDDFADIISKSPAVQDFLQYIVNRIGDLNKELSENEGQIQDFVDSLIKLLITAERVGRKFWEWKEEVVGVGVGFLVLSKTGNPILALFSTLATIIVLKFNEIAFFLIDLGVRIHLFFNRLHQMNLENLQELAEKVPWVGEHISGALDATWGRLLEKQRAKIVELGETSKELIAKYAPPNLIKNWLTGGEVELPTPPEETITPGGLPPPEAPTPILQQERDAFREIADEKVEITAETAELITGIEEARLENYLSFLYVEESQTEKNLRDRVKAYDSAFAAMSRYSDKFYKKGAHMGRALNAMLIAGTAEFVASYIESKTKQARYDAMEYAYQAIAALARKDFAAAGQYAAAAAQAGLVAGAGALMAGYLRAKGQEKADELVREREDWEKEDRDSDVSGEGQRRRAGGIVKARPIYINVSSQVTIQAGVVSFADAEYGVREFYENYIQDRVEQDIEDGVIAIP